jgi:hypothetical protein
MLNEGIVIGEREIHSILDNLRLKRISVEAALCGRHLEIPRITYQKIGQVTRTLDFY